MQLEQHEIKQIATQLENHIAIKVIAETEDRLINKVQLAKKMGCDPNHVTRMYVNRPGFPRLDPPGGSGRVMFSVKAVDKWIKDNQTIN